MSKKNKTKSVNNKKSPISEAPVQTSNNEEQSEQIAEKEIPTAPVEEVKEEKSPINVIDMGKFTENTQKSTVGGLDPNHQVDLIKMMHETFRKDPDAASKYGMTQDAVDKINSITAVSQVALLANEIAFAQNPFAIRMRKNQLEAIREIAPLIGVEINDKLLPAPDKDGNVEVSSKAIKVSNATKKQLKKENDIIEKSEPEMDVTKIDTPEKMKASLTYLFSQRQNVFSNIQKAVSLYSAWKKLNASKSDDKDELDKVTAMSRIDILKEIIDIVVEAPIVIGGIGNFMYTSTAYSKSPISAFCHFRNTSIDRKTGVPAVEDQSIADITKVLIIWATKIKIEQNKKSIENVNKNIEILKRDETKNADAIKDQNEKLVTLNANFKHFDDIISYVTNPSSDVADNLLTNVSAKDAPSMKVYKSILDSYYPAIDLANVDANCLKHNVQQYAGIITNMFRDPGAKLLTYNESAISELIFKDPATAETTEEKSETTENPDEPKK